VADDVMKRSATEASSGAAAPFPAGFSSRAETRADRARRLAYRGRFTILFVLLAVVAGVAVGSLVVLLERGSPAPAPPWSEWEPTGSPERRVAQIADRIPDSYRLPSGNQLATVTYVGSPTVTGPDGTTFQVRALAVRPSTAGGAAEADDIETVNAAGTVMFNLCGLGTSCSIPEGQATNDTLPGSCSRETCPILPIRRQAADSGRGASGPRNCAGRPSRSSRSARRG